MVTTKKASLLLHNNCLQFLKLTKRNVETKKNLIRIKTAPSKPWIIK